MNRGVLRRAMSQENVELIRRTQGEWNRTGTAALDAFHEDVEFLPLRAATEGAYSGLTGIQAFVEDTLEVFETFKMNYEYRDLGEQVLAWGTIHLRARGSGLETEIESGGLFDFRDGKIVRWEDFGSRGKALEAAGLSE